MTNIVIIDGHSIFRRGIYQVLENSHLSFEMTGFANPKEFLELCTADIPDLFIVSFNLRFTHADLAFLKLIKTDYSAQCIVIFSKEALHSWTKLCSKNGVKGFLTKESAPEEIIECIQMVLQGKRFVCKQVYKSLLSRQLSGYAT